MFEYQGVDGLIGRTFKGYRVTRFIARGGMGMVFAGVQESLDRPVAIKFLYPHLSDDDQFRERFEREARAAARLSHPNVVRILDFGSEGSLHYMILDLIDGESLRDRLARIHNEGLTFGTERIISILRQVGNALSDAHGVGYVHRDVKPGNILLTGDGHAYLTDFGVVKVLGSTQMTTTGTMIGTPEYMAPEQSTGTTNIGPAADLYSLAVIAYEMMTGRVPFQAPTPAGVMKMHMSDPPPPPSTIVPTFPRAAEAVLMRALSKSPEDRQESIDAFIADFVAAVQAPAQFTVTAPDDSQTVAGYMAPTSQAVQQNAAAPNMGPGSRGPAAGRPRWMIGGGGIAGLVLIAILLGVFLLRDASNGDNDAAPVAAAGNATPTATLPTATSTAVPTTPGEVGVAAKPTEAKPSPTATETAPPPTATADGASPTAYVAAATATPKQDDARPIILFASKRGDDPSSRIYAMNPDGGNQRPLTSTKGQSTDPRISPDGEMILFTALSQGQDGYGYATGDTANGAGSSDIYVASIDGEKATNLTSDSPARNIGWSWSPDGATIAFTSDRDGNPEIYTMARDGSNVTRITNDPAYDGWPSWTPDGNRMVFASDRSGNMEIFIMNSDGSNIQQLTDRPYMDDTYPSVSLDGTKIAFASQNPDSGASEIYAMNVDGTNLIQLTNAGGLNTAPSWSPDGTRIAFVSDRDGDQNIFRMNVDGSGQTDGSDQTRLTDDPGDDVAPTWSRVVTNGVQQY